MEDEFDLQGFMMTYGNELVAQLRMRLGASNPYPYAPGKFGNAYSDKGLDGPDWKARKKRNPDYSGSAPKSVEGSGGLADSIEAVWQQDVQTLGILINDYYKVVEYGRKPGTFAPIAPLKEWATKKGFPESAAYAINRNIYKFGIAPTFFFGNSVDAIVEQLAEDFEDDLDTYIEMFMNNMIEKPLKTNSEK